MTAVTEHATILTSKLMISPERIIEFADWQAKLNATIAAYPGFVSLEILSPVPPGQPQWLIVQRFYSADDAASWHKSEGRRQLMDQLSKYLIDTKDSIQEIFSSDSNMKGGITEVFVTQVSPDKEKIYREWTAKIHQAEAKFPGFRGVYVQSPGQTGGVNWITLLQFDTPENLDIWLNSPERQQVLDEAKSMITSLESHRMISPYSAWFSSVAIDGELPSIWKQTMLVLLVLFPIVMFEIKYLLPATAGLNVSLSTFIGNAISVTLFSWPMMPIALYFLGWWLVPKQKKRLLATVIGTLVLVLLYLIEIVLFWHFL